MTICVLIIHCYKTAVFFVHDIVLSSRCCLCTNIHYVTILIGPCPVIIHNIFSYSLLSYEILIELIRMICTQQNRTTRSLLVHFKLAGYNIKNPDHASRQPTELAWQIPIACIQCWDTPDDGQWTCPKHVESLSNKFEKKCASRWLSLYS
jgi:hypothetical protein